MNLEKILNNTRFTTASIDLNFYQRRQGLGFEMKVERVNKDILRDVRKKSYLEIKPEIEEKIESSSEESISKYKFINKKKK